MRARLARQRSAQGEPARRGIRLEPAGSVALVFLAALFSWWAWKEGAYFPAVYLPGTIALGAGIAMLAIGGPLRIDLGLSRPVMVALGALAALALWTGASAIWSPAPDVALEDAVRTGAYALAFAAGIWVASLLGARMELFAAVPVAAAAVAGIVAAAGLALGDSPRELLEADGTLEFPLGYRNAAAAFFAIATFPAVGLAAEARLGWPLRALALGAAGLCLSLFWLCQSRGAVLALALGALAFVLLAPLRVRYLAWLALACLPALAAIPPALDLFQATTDRGLAGAVAEMHAAGATVAGATLAALALGALAARFEPRLPLLRSSSPAGNRAVAAGVGALVAVAAVAFVAAVGDPVDWVGDRVEEFREGGSGDLAAESSRFSFNAGSDRRDLWRIALGEAGDAPLLGTGAGGYPYAYLREREVPYQNALDAHSVELELLAELGLPGLTLLLAALGGAALGAWRSRRLGPASAALSTMALAAATVWLVHSSIDWFWSYPALTAPVFALLGAACATPLRVLRPRRGRILRGGLLAGAGLATLLAVPLFLSDRYLERAYSTFRTDLELSYRDLDRARALNPFADAPLLAEGAIASETGDPDRALTALREAADERPQEWATHYLLAELLAEDDPEAARTEIGLALELNPLSARVRRLASALGVEPPDTDLPTG